MAKKKVIYLDQNFISEIAKSKKNDKVDRGFEQIFELLHQGFLDEKLVVPRSTVHKKETALATQYKEIIREHHGFMGQIRMEDFTHIYGYQVYRAAEKFLGLKAESLRQREGFSENPNKKTERFYISVDSGLWEDGGYRAEKREMAELLNKAKDLANSEERSFKEQRGRELEAQQQLFLKRYSYLVATLFHKDQSKLVEFSKSHEFKEIPYVDITVNLWASLFVHHSKRKIHESDYADIESIAMYLPYSDVFATDQFMSELIKQRKLDIQYNARVFSSNKEGLSGLTHYLKRSLARKKPANWPKVSIFVVPDEKIKKNSWEFFRKLGNQCHSDEKGTNWVEIYAFDDNKMPKYYDPRIKQFWPFYGLQDVTVLKIDKSKKIYDLCSKNSRTERFVLIDSYRELPANFIQVLFNNLKEGKSQILNYKILTRNIN